MYKPVMRKYDQHASVYTVILYDRRCIPSIPSITQQNHCYWYRTSTMPL